MADDADSKSVGRKPVWVQVPPPALSHGLGISGLLSKINDFKAFCIKHNYLGA